MEFIFSKVVCFQHIIRNNFRRMRLKLKFILWETSYFRQWNNIQAGAWNGNNLIAKAFDRNMSKIKAAVLFE